MKFFQILFISKAGWKSECIMPAKDKDDAIAKFKKFRKLTNDEDYVKISSVNELNEMSPELKNFCESLIKPSAEVIRNRVASIFKD